VISEIPIMMMKKVLATSSSGYGRFDRLMSIPAIGPITALAGRWKWAKCSAFRPSRKPCGGLCGEQKDSGNIVPRTPLSKQPNKHLQTTLMEAAKMAPRYTPAWRCCMTARSNEAMPTARH
jgi:transposase